MHHQVCYRNGIEFGWCYLFSSSGSSIKDVAYLRCVPLTLMPQTHTQFTCWESITSHPPSTNNVSPGPCPIQMGVVARVSHHQFFFSFFSSSSLYNSEKRSSYRKREIEPKHAKLPSATLESTILWSSSSKLFLSGQWTLSLFFSLLCYSCKIIEAII